MEYLEYGFGKGQDVYVLDLKSKLQRKTHEKQRAFQIFGVNYSNGGNDEDIAHCIMFGGLQVSWKILMSDMAIFPSVLLRYSVFCKRIAFLVQHAVSSVHTQYPIQKKNKVPIPMLKCQGIKDPTRVEMKSPSND